MNAELTDTDGLQPVRGWVGYDGDCGVCSAVVRCWQAVFERRGFVFVPLRNAWLRERLGLREGELLIEIKLLLANGSISGGIDAIACLLRAVWWLAPAGFLIMTPGLRGLPRLLYQWGAKRRHRFGACRGPATKAAFHRTHSTFLELP